MAMFVKKLIKKATKKPTAIPPNGFGPEDLDPRLISHYGIPAGSNSMAYDPIQKILALSTKDGRIKLFGSGNTQALLQSEMAVPSKFMQFVHNQGILLNITVDNRIEVWDIGREQLVDEHSFQEEITSFAVMQQSLYMYIGDRPGNVSVLKLDEDVFNLTIMKYHIPFSESHCKTSEDADDDSTVISILPQPMAESRRILIIFKDGILSLWGVQESKSMFTAGRNASHGMGSEARKVVSACWACPFGSKVVIGYSSGEIFLWGVPKISELKNSEICQKGLSGAQNIPLLKLNLGYKIDKVPVVSLRWNFADGKGSRLYINGVSACGSSCSFQVILLNGNTETRMVKMILPLPEACQDMEIVSSFSEQSKNKQNVLILLLKSGQLCIYDDLEIENYLLKSQSKSLLQLPKRVDVRVPFIYSSVTVAKLLSKKTDTSKVPDEDHGLLVNKFHSLFTMETRDGNYLSSARFSGFTKVNNLYITGHQDGSINFWDASCLFLLPVLSIRQQNEDDHSLSDSAVKALYFDIYTQILISGHQSGLVRIFTFKTALSVTDNIVTYLQAKQGCNYNADNVKLNGAIVSINMSPDTNRVAVGTEKGYVVVIKIEGAEILYQKHISSEPYSSLISLQFQNCILHEKNVLLIATEDSSVAIVEEDTVHTLNTTMIRPKNASKALFMQILDMKDDVQNLPLILLCSEKSVRLYFLFHAMQGLKKVYNKKKLHGTCCWASTFYSSISDSDCALILLFSNGNMEIRSLPELNLLKETSLRGLTFSSSQAKAKLDGALCSSYNGDLILVKGDQEIFFYSISQKEANRSLESIGQVYKKGVSVTAQQFPTQLAVNHKEKKMGIFSAVIKDMKGSKAKEEQAIDSDSCATAKDLFILFSMRNFPLDADNRNGEMMNDKDVELNIEDIDLEDLEEKSKEANIVMFNKQFGKKFNAIKGKLKGKTAKASDSLEKEADENEKPKGTVDEIKKRYGYASTGVSDIAKASQSKLRENIQKLQGIGLRTTEMQNSASSFSIMAKEVLRTVEQGKKT